MPLEILQNSVPKNYIKYTRYGTSYLAYCYICHQQMYCPPYYRHVCDKCTLSLDAQQIVWQKAQNEYPELKV
jgi:hypothetical protein